MVAHCPVYFLIYTVLHINTETETRKLVTACYSCCFNNEIDFINLIGCDEGFYQGCIIVGCMQSYAQSFSRNSDVRSLKIFSYSGLSKAS